MRKIGGTPLAKTNLLNHFGSLATHQPPSPYKFFCYASLNPALKASFLLETPARRTLGFGGLCHSNGLRPLPPTPTGSSCRSFLSYFVFCVISHCSCLFPFFKNFLCVPAFASFSSLVFIGLFNAPAETSNENHAKFLSETAES